MFSARLCLFLVVILGCTEAAFAQQAAAPAQTAAGNIVLDVVVTPKSGPPVGNLQQQDFTVLDNKVSRSLTSFQAVDGRQAPIDIILVVDDVNTGADHVAYDRDQIDKFLKADGGHLVHPMVIAFITDSGLKIPSAEFSTDGNVLSEAMNKQPVSLHTIARNGGFDALTERFDLSMKAFRQLVGAAAGRSGRKFMIWVSPGWPVLSGADIQQQIDQKQHEQIFQNIVETSTQLRRGGITIYSIDPLGVSDFGTHAFDWQDYVKGVSKPGQTEWGNIALQVLAAQSGGLTFTIGNDVSGELQKSVADASAYYELTFAPPSDEKPNTYHHLEVRVSKPGLAARTRDGYYSHP